MVRAQGTNVALITGHFHPHYPRSHELSVCKSCNKKLKPRCMHTWIFRLAIVIKKVVWKHNEMSWGLFLMLLTFGGLLTITQTFTNFNRPWCKVHSQILSPCYPKMDKWLLNATTIYGMWLLGNVQIICSSCWHDNRGTVRVYSMPSPYINPPRPQGWYEGTVHVGKYALFIVMLG